MYKAWFVVTILWCISFSGTYTITLLMVVNLAGGQLLLLTENSVTTLSDNFSKEDPHKPATKFPEMCARVPANCGPFLLSLGNDSLLLIPSYSFVKYFKLTNFSVEYVNKLSITNCLRYISTGKGNNEFYAICLKNQTQEMTTVTYKIRYTDHFELEVSKYGYGYGTHIDMDSPLVVTFSDSSDPVVLYITNVEDGAELFIKDLNAGGDVYDHVSLPSDCIAPYELKHLHQLNALLKCSNGLLYEYDGNIMEFAKLPFQSIAMVEQCVNSSSFVMVTNQGNILLNKTTKNLMRIPFLKITVDSVQLDALSSFACYWNGTATIFYFTVSHINDMIYYLNIPLEYVAESRTVIEAHQMAKFAVHAPLRIIQSSIVGPAWISRLTDQDNDTQDTVFIINIKTESSGYYLSNGPAYVQSYQDQPFHIHFDAIVKDETTSEPENANSNGFPQTLTILISTSVFSIVAIIVVAMIFGLMYIVYHRKQRESTYSTLREGSSEASSVANEHETAFNDEGNEPPTGHTVSQDQSNTGVSSTNNSQTVEEWNCNPPNLPTADQTLQIANSQTTRPDLTAVDSDIQLQTAVDSNPQVDHNNTLGNRFNYHINSELIPAEEATNQNDSNIREAHVLGVLLDTTGSDRISIGSEDNSPDSDDETTVH